MSEAKAPLKNTSPKAVPTQLESRPSDGASDPDETLNTSAATALSVAERASQARSIGLYQLTRKLGEGGMGQVWLAEQTAPIKRQVALKLIRTGRYDDSVLQRFYTERQSLAMMDHPAIAKVFDAGATLDGQPYFVMEYVPGQPITDYCDRKRLKIRERLELFIKVCEGVQHAHQKSVMHRDLKPANILVVELDGKAVPRIIDFGLAKAASPQLTTVATSPAHENWRELYKAAIFEADNNKVWERIALAEWALAVRARELLFTEEEHFQERLAVDAAIYALQVLRTTKTGSDERRTGTHRVHVAEGDC